MGPGANYLMNLRMIGFRHGSLHVHIFRSEHGYFGHWMLVVWQLLRAFATTGLFYFIEQESVGITGAFFSLNYYSVSDFPDTY